MAPRPTSMNPKLKLCCVALPAFSPTERSAHFTLPSSLNGVTDFLFGPVEGAFPSPVCVAYVRCKTGRRYARVVRLVTGDFAATEAASFIFGIVKGTTGP